MAFFLQSVPAKALHRILSEIFVDILSAQDRQGFRPHVVAQNKTTPQQARETLALLQAGFQPWRCHAVGMDLWRYLGGPWALEESYDFTRGRTR